MGSMPERKWVRLELLYYLMSSDSQVRILLLSFLFCHASSFFRPCRLDLIKTIIYYLRTRRFELLLSTFFAVVRSDHSRILCFCILPLLKVMASSVVCASQFLVYSYIASKNASPLAANAV